MTSEADFERAVRAGTKSGAASSRTLQHRSATKSNIPRRSRGLCGSLRSRAGRYGSFMRRGQESRRAHPLFCSRCINCFDIMGFSRFVKMRTIASFC